MQIVIHCQCKNSYFTLPTCVHCSNPETKHGKKYVYVHDNIYIFDNNMEKNQTTNPRYLKVQGDHLKIKSMYKLS